MIRRILIVVRAPFLFARRSVRAAWEVQHRERERLWAEMAQVRGLMPLLMKQRNGYRWSDADRRQIRARLRTLGALGPYLVLFVSPGGLLALPVLAWWLDRRRRRRDGAARTPAEPIN